MYLKVDIKIQDNDYLPFFNNNEEILDYINSKLRHELLDKIHDLQVIEHPNPDKLTEIQTETIVIVNPEAFFNKLKELHGERLSPNGFIDKIVDYVSHEKV